MSRENCSVGGSRIDDFLRIPSAALGFALESSPETDTFLSPYLGFWLRIISTTRAVWSTLG